MRPSWSPSSPTVSAIEIRALVRDLQENGVPIEAIEQRDVRADDLVDADARLSAAAYLDLLALGAERTGDPAYALHFGARCEPARGGIVYNIAATSETYLEGFEIAIRYARLLNDVTRVELDTATERAVFRVFVPDARFRRADVIDAALGRAASTMRGLWGPSFVLREARFSSPEPTAPRHAAAHAELLGRRVRYEASEDALVFERRWLLAPQPGHQPYVHHVLAERAAALLASLGERESLSARAHALVVERLSRSGADVRAVARALGMSRQTLHRRLASEGTSFAAIVASLRREIAVAQLAGGTLSIAEIALLLGYSEPAAFHRAFRRWTGKSPAQYRAAERARRRRPDV